jgi:peptidoglycan/xylan/chitin deacetylase (PgdA/CDA1 family)
LRSAILTYHSIDDSGSLISVSPSLFEQQMESLAQSGVPVVALDQVLSVRGSVALTFDDGYRNFADVALPVLERLQFPATLFVVSGFCGRRNEWPDQPAGAMPSLPLLPWQELAALPPSVALGAHTITHRDLRKLSREDCEHELSDCREEIKRRTSRPVRWLAYPYGASSPELRLLAGRHFELAVGTTLAYVSRRSDRFDLPRIDAYYLRRERSLGQLFSGSRAAYLGVRRVLRAARKRVLQ